MSATHEANSQEPREINRLKARLVEQLDDLPANICLAAFMDLALTFLFAVVPLQEQEAFWTDAYKLNRNYSVDGIASEVIN